MPDSEQAQAEQTIAPGQEAGQPSPPQRPIVRWRLIVFAAAIAALALGYYAGRFARSVSGFSQDDIRQHAGELKTVPSDAPVPSALASPEPDRPLPATAEALIDETTAIVDQLVETYPDEPDALEIKARLQRWLGNSKGADQTWGRCLELNPRYVHAFVGMASAAAENGDYEKAAELAKEAVELEPANFLARSVLADALINLGRASEVSQTLEEFVKADPRSQGYFLLGQASFQLGQYKQAKEYYEAAIRKYPDYMNAYHGLASACDRLGLSEQAAMAREKFQELGSPEQAAKRIRGIEVSDLEMMYGNAAALLSDAGRVCFVRGKEGQAEVLWLRAAALDPQHVDCRQSLAFLCRRADRLGEAIGWLGELAHLEPGNPSYHVEIGNLCEDLSGPAAAEQAFRRACEAAPENAEGYAALTDLLLRYEHNVPESVTLAAKAVQYSPTARNYAMLSAAQRANGDLAHALESIEQAIRLAPQSASYRAVRDAIQAAQPSGSKE